MNLKNLFTLAIKVEDFNTARKKPEFIKKLRKLTIRPQSGMNYELNHFERIATHREVNCKIITAYRNRQLVGWALLSKESTDFWFRNSPDGYQSQWGTLFQVYVDPAYRRQGIASALLNAAKKRVRGESLCICPHDDQSSGFYNKLINMGAKIL